MRDEFSTHRCLGKERRRLLEAAKRTVSRSFLCLEFIVFSWQIGPVNSIVQLPSQLGIARRRLDSASATLSFFLLFPVFLLLSNERFSFMYKVYYQNKKRPTLWLHSSLSLFTAPFIVAAFRFFFL